jgi:hypothetical protein
MNASGSMIDLTIGLGTGHAAAASCHTGLLCGRRSSREGIKLTSVGGCLEKSVVEETTVEGGGLERDTGNRQANSTNSRKKES